LLGDIFTTAMIPLLRPKVAIQCNRFQAIQCLLLSLLEGRSLLKHKRLCVRACTSGCQRAFVQARACSRGIGKMVSIPWRLSQPTHHSNPLPKQIMIMNGLLFTHAQEKGSSNNTPSTSMAIDLDPFTPGCSELGNAISMT
jgi:hypothetical protein